MSAVFVHTLYKHTLHNRMFNYIKSNYILWIKSRSVDGCSQLEYDHITTINNTRCKKKGIYDLNFPRHLSRLRRKFRMKDACTNNCFWVSTSKWQKLAIAHVGTNGVSNSYFAQLIMCLKWWIYKKEEYLVPQTAVCLI